MSWVSFLLVLAAHFLTRSLISRPGTSQAASQLNENRSDFSQDLSGKSRYCRPIHRRSAPRSGRSPNLSVSNYIHRPRSNRDPRFPVEIATSNCRHAVVAHDTPNLSPTIVRYHEDGFCWHTRHYRLVRGAVINQTDRVGGLRQGSSLKLPTPLLTPLCTLLEVATWTPQATQNHGPKPPQRAQKAIASHTLATLGSRYYRT